jgi:hypothetical protein
MKKIFFVFGLLMVMVLFAEAQMVSQYSYKLDNGISVKMEHCWNQVWVQQSYAPLAAGDKTPLAFNIRTLGDLTSGSTYKLFKDGKEVMLQGATPGTYNVKFTFKLSGTPGTLSFVADNIVIKEKSKTTVSVTLYDYQLMIEESPETLNGLTHFETLVNRCKTHTIQDVYFGAPTFYNIDQHDKAIPADVTISKTAGKIKAGTYDMLVSIGISGQTHKIWLENFKMKPDVFYKISTNLNAGGIQYMGSDNSMGMMQLYPAGTAAKQSGTPTPVKSLEVISYSNVKVANCCSPGTYDVLLNFKNGTKFEWRKNVIIQTGIKTDVK